MEVIVHYPQTQKGKESLRHRVSEIQAQFIISYVENLNCSLEQKYQLIDDIAEEMREQAKEENKKTSNVSAGAELDTPRTTA